MNLFENLYSKVENAVLKNAPLQKLRINMALKDDAPSRRIEREAITLQAQSLNEWKLAVSMATDTDNPDRSALEKLYDNLMLDNHLASVIDSRILYCQRSPFKIVNEKGDENLELTWLFERTWFEDFIRLTLLSRFQGNTLIELFDIDELTKEISQSTLIPIGHYNTRKGIIQKTPGDMTGWDYKTGGLMPYYIQVGKDDELGLLSQLAPIVLAKKLGLGSWLDYIEKYGVPSLFIFTDREDDARLNQLYEAAANFKSNGFMVGRGNEKIEVGKDISGGNPDNFDKLIDRANSEISKRILGGSGLTDEKGFVGSTEIQYKLAKDRFESDKLLIKNVINQQLIPRLLKLSPTYSVLNGYYFDWDNTESFSVKDYTDIVSTLSQHYELDTAQIEEKTGIKILGVKALQPPIGEFERGDAKKKSPVAK